jgi:predicted AAA+ superfamily ATPase
MQPILATCQPRADILTGVFNPEIFTASLSQVMDCYRGRATPMHTLYSEAEQFFREATYPTEGLCMVLAEVFGRLAGDNAMPAIHRLETAFGGGKTHTLIALTHLGFRGEALYHRVEVDAASYAAPGRNYFEAVLGNHKVLIMLDELAQYAARLETAIPNGGDQLAAFLMGLHTYARNNAGIAVVLTLASQTDAFARQTQRLTDLDRVELIARRVAHFTREEAMYWLSRMTSFGPDANRWAVAGLRLMLGGHANDPAVERMLERLREVK